MNKAEIICELENMVVARLFGRQPWLADRETRGAVYRKLIQMGLMEESGGFTPLGKELDVELFTVFMGLWCQYDVPTILEEHGFIDESEFDAYVECTSYDGDLLLVGYVKRAYFDYRKAAKFLH